MARRDAERPLPAQLRRHQCSPLVIESSIGNIADLATLSFGRDDAEALIRAFYPTSTGKFARDCASPRAPPSTALDAVGVGRVAVDGEPTCAVPAAPGPGRRPRPLWRRSGRSRRRARRATRRRRAAGRRCG